MSTFLIVAHVFICILLVLVVLVQSGKEGGIGLMYGGGSQSVFGSSGGANFFTKFTAATAALFMITSLTLTVIKAGKKTSIFEDVKAPAKQSKSSAEKPAKK